MIGILGAVAAGIGGITSTIGGLSRMASGAKMMRNAQEAINKYRRQKLQNAYQDVGVSRLGADLQRQENARMAATSVDALRSAGVRGLGAVGSVQRNTQAMNQGIAADLDRQRQGINMAQAQDNAQIRAMQEQREREDLAGLGRQLEVGRQDKFGGIQDISQGMLSLGSIGLNAAGGMGAGGARPQLSPVQTNPAGLAPTPGYSLPVPTQPAGITGMGQLTAPLINQYI